MGPGPSNPDQNSSINSMNMGTMNHDSSSTAWMWYVIGGVVVIGAVALGYFYSSQISTMSTQSPVAEQAQTVPVATGNTPEEISADFNMIPDDSAALDQAAAASAQAVQGF